MFRGKSSERSAHNLYIISLTLEIGGFGILILLMRESRLRVNNLSKVKGLGSEGLCF